ncbi:peptide/nickel transport system ATP-binding protein [Jannaschia faecimaris]|uniref:Peptide/nickel transport system ATP-binding protein n=1 Tax=Jannaschia faecimaris TaxID=1244108 RepID=A0A1H3TGI5_9RHOB|nr:dipeptide ABC transporter ATP-binding protein [Jannaschia faecimaris]SDZ48439.1 peptide/nickel transport system ATP-binding protein [Jannaschia faecimaris]
MKPILEAQNVTKHFPTGGGLFQKKGLVKAVDGVSLSITPGETFAIVGESGCGKSTLARVLMRLLDTTSGDVMFDGKQVTGAQGTALSALRRDVQFIFQDPFSSLNPRMSVGRLVGEPLEVHAPELTKGERRAKVSELLAQVGLRPEHADRYPHEFSGGQRQRIGIARALASGPRLIIGDEPVSALDVSVQAQVVNLLGDLGRDLGLTLILIAHDLAVIRHMSDRVAVMYLGKIVEQGTADDLFENPRHPYTRALLDAIPDLDDQGGASRARIEGEMPSPSAPPPGCAFHTRCPHATELCRTKVPAPEETPDGHMTACHHWQDIAVARRKTTPRSRSPATEARLELYAKATEGTQIIPVASKTPDREETK